MNPLPQQSEQLVTRLEVSLLALNKVAARRLFQESGLAPLDFAEAVMVPALERIGNAWENGAVALSQVYMSGRICEGLIEEHLTLRSCAACQHPPMAIAVLNDPHMLGMRMVYSVLRASGYHLLNYGQINLTDLVAKVVQDRIEILIISALMLSSALQVRELRERLDALGLQVKLVVGGAPFRLDEHLWREVGADASSPTASGAVAVVKDLVEAMK